MNLEIGPGKRRLPGFLTLNIGTRNTDVQGLAESLPFAPNSFNLIYASHVIEHIAWFDNKKALAEWVRVLAVGGWLEVWTVDYKKIANLLEMAEHPDGWGDWFPDKWRRYNKDKDPYKWLAGRTFAYGSSPSDPNWHKSLYTAKYLSALMRQAGLSNVKQMDRREVRGQDHGWINLGVKGQKL